MLRCATGGRIVRVVSDWLATAIFRAIKLCHTFWAMSSRHAELFGAMAGGDPVGAHSLCEFRLVRYAVRSGFANFLGDVG